MKTKFLLVFCVLLINTLLFAHDFKKDGIYYNFLGGDSIEVTGYENYSNSYSGNVTIPEKVEYNDTIYRVTTIGNSAFYYCSNLTSITIPNTITTIGKLAFYKCRSLKSVVIPNSVTTIGEEVFSLCDDLVSIILSNNIVTISDKAFSSCTKLKSITIPNSVAIIGNSAFLNCSNLTSIVIPHSVTSIGSSAFHSCSTLTSITIPNSVIYIDCYAFAGCSKLENISVESDNPIYHSAGNCIIETASKILHTGCNNSLIPIDGSITAIGDGAFSNCTNIKSITLPNDITTIGKNAFYKCSNLESITIPNSVITINDGAFADCTNLITITLPNSITTIGRATFSGCYNLSSMTIPDNITQISQKLFDGCSNLSSITLGKSITRIGSYAFYRCTNLTSIIIPNSVVSIDHNAFDGCSKLSTITIPNSVTTIDDCAFSSCSSLSSITIPQSVISIGERVFYLCSNLQYNNFGNAKYLGNPENPYHALITYIDESITSCTINSKSITIAGGAFRGCRSLTSINIPKSVMMIGDAICAACPNIETITVVTDNPNYHSVTNCLIETATKRLHTGCKNSVIPTDGTVTSINNEAFSICKNLKSISIPNCITTIGNKAFLWCYGLTTITIGHSVTEIGSQAFEDCYSLNEIICRATIPPTITDFTFYQVDHSIPLYVPEESIETYKTAMYWNEFTNIQGIPESITEISNIKSTDTTLTHKIIQNGTIYILKPSGEKYTIDGIRVM